MLWAFHKHHADFSWPTKVRALFITILGGRQSVARRFSIRLPHKASVFLHDKDIDYGVGISMVASQQMTSSKNNNRKTTSPTVRHIEGPSATLRGNKPRHKKKK